MSRQLGEARGLQQEGLFGLHGGLGAAAVALRHHVGGLAHAVAARTRFLEGREERKKKEEEGERDKGREREMRKRGRAEHVMVLTLRFVPGTEFLFKIGGLSVSDLTSFQTLVSLTHSACLNYTTASPCSLPSELSPRLHVWPHVHPISVGMATHLPRVHSVTVLSNAPLFED